MQPTYQVLLRVFKQSKYKSVVVRIQFLNTYGKQLLRRRKVDFESIVH